MRRSLCNAMCVATALLLTTASAATAATIGPEPTIFSTDVGVGGFTPGDVLTHGPLSADPVNPPWVGVPAAPLLALPDALFCPGCQIDAMSRGMDLEKRGGDVTHGILPDQQNGFLFSVDRAATGASGDVVAEAGGDGAAGDVYVSLLKISGAGAVTVHTPGGNELLYDADGSHGLPGLGLSESPGSEDNLDALDVTFAGHPGALALSPLFFSTDAIGGGADIFVFDGVSSSIYATDTDLGLSDNDNIDALILAENGTPGFQAPTGLFDWTDSSADMIFFSLDPTSSRIGTPDAFGGDIIGPGDVLTVTSSGIEVLIAASALGLGVNDNLDALDVVPEPSTYAMAAMAFFGLGFIGWRRRRK